MKKQLIHSLFTIALATGISATANASIDDYGPLLTPSAIAGIAVEDALQASNEIQVAAHTVSRTHTRTHSYTHHYSYGHSRSNSHSNSRSHINTHIRTHHSSGSSRPSHNSHIVSRTHIHSHGDHD